MDCFEAALCSLCIETYVLGPVNVKWNSLPRIDDVVSDVRIRYWPLAAKGNRTYDWLRVV